MPDYQNEISDLAQADRCIAEGNRRVGRLAALMAERRAAGWDTAEAEKLLRALHETVQLWRIRRRLILDTLERL